MMMGDTKQPLHQSHEAVVGPGGRGNIRQRDDENSTKAALHASFQTPDEVPFDELYDGNQIPWDEAENDIVRECDFSKTQSTAWRRYGQAKRRKLLEEDRIKGGQEFTLNGSCSLERYFEVAQRALEQFRRMYLSETKLEDTYIMGHRMICFFTGCLPKHPDFRKPEFSGLRRKSRSELEVLQRSLEDVALQIDEEECNRYVDDLQLNLDDDDDSDDEIFEELKTEPLQVRKEGGWDAFTGWAQEEPKTESATLETADSSGTESPSYDISSEDDSAPDLHLEFLDFSDYEDNIDEPAAEPIYVELGSEFLERIAKEKVCYETDSEAADSWLPGHESISPPDSFAPGIICDPAKLAFQRLSHSPPRTNLKPPPTNFRPPRFQQSPVRQKPVVMKPDPPHLDTAIQAEIDHFLQVDYDDEHDPVEDEIQRYLNSSVEADPDDIFQSSMVRLRKKSHHTSPRVAHSTTRRTRALDPPADSDENQNMFPDGWVSFDSVDSDSSPLASEWPRSPQWRNRTRLEP